MGRGRTYRTCLWSLLCVFRDYFNIPYPLSPGARSWHIGVMTEASSNSRLAFLNGEWIDSARLAIPFDDLGFAQGVAVVERLRTFGHQVFCLEEHLLRLQRSLAIVGWDVEGISQTIASAVVELLERNRAQMEPGDDWAVAAVATPGKTSDAANPTIAVHGHPLPFSDWASLYNTGVEVIVSDVRQVPRNCWPSELKCRSRMHYYLADRQAGAASPGARAILLDQSGNLAETSTTNLVAYYAEHGLITPRQENVLPGISLQVLFALAEQLGIPCQEHDLTPADFAQADEAFLTSTSVCLLPITRQNGRTLSTGTPGPVYRQLLDAWSHLVGTDIAAQAHQFASRN